MHVDMPSRNCSGVRDFIRYLTALHTDLDALLAFYGTRRCRNASFRTYHLRQKLLHSVYQTLTNNGMPTVIFFGAGKFWTSSRGHPASPLSLLRRFLSQRCIVRLVDEFRTSVICSRCTERMDGRSPHGSWHLKVCRSGCQKLWNRKAVLNVANMGGFSIDRLADQYAVEMWNAKPVPRTT